MHYMQALMRAFPQTKMQEPRFLEHRLSWDIDPLDMYGVVCGALVDMHGRSIDSEVQG